MTLNGGYSCSWDMAGFSFRILVAGERCNITGEYFEKGSMSEWKVVICYQTLAGEFSLVKGVWIFRSLSLSAWSFVLDLRGSFLNVVFNIVADKKI